MVGNLPSWTVLKDSSSSTRPSEESSQDMQDELELTPPARKRKLGASVSDDESAFRPKPSKKPRPTDATAHRSSPAPRARAKPPPPTSEKRPAPPVSICTDVSQSGTKKKKRKIVSPTEGPVTETSASSAPVRRPRNSGAPPPRPKSPLITQAGIRKVSAKAPAAGATKAGPSTGKKPTSRKPLVVVRVPKQKQKQKATAERHKSVIVLSGDDKPVSAPIRSTQNRVSIAAKPPRDSAPFKSPSDVIEISDDDDDVPPKASAARKPPSRTSMQGGYEIIILDSEDDELPPVIAAPSASTANSQATVVSADQQDMLQDAEPQFEPSSDTWDQSLDEIFHAPTEDLPGPVDEPVPPLAESSPAAEFPMLVDEPGEHLDDGGPLTEELSLEPAPPPPSTSPVPDFGVRAIKDEPVVSSDPKLTFIPDLGRQDWDEPMVPSAGSPFVSHAELENLDIPATQDEMQDAGTNVGKARETAAQSSPEGAGNVSVPGSGDSSSSDECHASTSNALREEDARLSMSVNSQLRISNEPVVEQKPDPPPLTQVPTLDLKALCTPKARKKRRNDGWTRSPVLFSSRKGSIRRLSSVFPSQSPPATDAPRHDGATHGSSSSRATGSDGAHPDSVITASPESNSDDATGLLNHEFTQVSPSGGDRSISPPKPRRVVRWGCKPLYNGPNGFFKGVLPASGSVSKGLARSPAGDKSLTLQSRHGSVAKASPSPVGWSASLPHAVVRGGVVGGHDSPIFSRPASSEANVTTNPPESESSLTSPSLTGSSSRSDHAMDQDPVDSIVKASPSPADVPASSPHAIVDGGKVGGHDGHILSCPLSPEANVTANPPELESSLDAPSVADRSDEYATVKSPFLLQLQQSGPGTSDAMDVDDATVPTVPTEVGGSFDQPMSIPTSRRTVAESSLEPIENTAVPQLSSSDNGEQPQAPPSSTVSATQSELKSSLSKLPTPISVLRVAPGGRKGAYGHPVQPQPTAPPRELPLGSSLPEAINAASHANQNIRHFIDLTSDGEYVRSDAMGSPKTSRHSSSSLRRSSAQCLSWNAQTYSPTRTPALGATTTASSVILSGPDKRGSSQASIGLKPPSQLKRNFTVDDLHDLRAKVMSTASDSLPSSTSSNSSVPSSEPYLRSPVPGPFVESVPFRKPPTVPLPRRRSAVWSSASLQSDAAITGSVDVNSIASTSTESTSLDTFRSSGSQVAANTTSEEEEEQECLGILAHPDIPDVEMFNQAEEDAPIVTRTRTRLRSHASSETSTASGGPRKSSRASSSGSSSIGPADPVHNPFTEPRVEIRSGSNDGTDIYEILSAAHGFEVMTWPKTRAKMVTEFAPLCQLAEDIPHELEDRMNVLPSFARRNVQVAVFEEAIKENTASDEPHAPHIRIINDVDDELTPPYEFHYSNLMWHGRGVPHPDLKNLVGCDCFGSCEPNSRTCSCLKRQRQFWEQTGFMYDRRGRLRMHDYPIFECNAFCGCEGHCINRVVQNGRKFGVDIRKTPDKGWGIFAGAKKIPANTFIGIYAGEYLTDDQGEERGTLYNKFGRTYLFDLDFHHLKEDNPDWTTQYCVDAYHAGNFTRYLNHSCDPNCNINACYINEANIEKPLLTIFTSRDVDPGQELCFSYFGSIDDDAHVEDVKTVINDAVYAPCRCGAVRCRGSMWS